MSDVIGMFGAISGGTQNALAMLDIPQDGFIIGIDWDMFALLDATSELCEVELSFIATNQLGTNDVRGRISSVGTGAVVLTAVGINTNSVQKWVGSIDIPVSGGERLFLHAGSTAGVSGNVRCNLHVDLGTTTRRSARRR